MPIVLTLTTQDGHGLPWELPASTLVSTMTQVPVGFRLRGDRDLTEVNVVIGNYVFECLVTGASLISWYATFLQLYHVETWRPRSIVAQTS